MIGNFTPSLKNGKTLGLAILLSALILLTQNQISFAQCWCVWENGGIGNPTYGCAKGSPDYTTDSECSQSCKAQGLPNYFFPAGAFGVDGAASEAKCEEIKKKYAAEREQKKND